MIIVPQENRIINPFERNDIPPPETLQCFGGMAGGFGPRGIFWAGQSTPPATNHPFLIGLSTLATSNGPAPPTLTAPFVVAVSSLASTATGGTVTPTVSTPSTNDIVIAVIQRTGLDTVDLAPSAPAGEGWTLHAHSIAPLNTCPAGWLRYDIFWKRWGAGGGQIDDASPTFSYTARSNYGWGVVLTVVRGCVTSGSPFEDFNINSDTHAVTGPTLTSASVNSGGPARLSLRFYVSVSINDDSGLSGFSAGETGIYSGIPYRTSIAAGHWASAKVAASSKEITGSGAIGTATVGGGNSIQRWIAFTAIFKPANADAPTNDTITPLISTPSTNDIVIAAVHRINGGAAPQPPSGQGWTSLIASSTGAPPTPAFFSLWWKRWGAGFTDDTTPTWTITDPNNTPWGIILSVWRRCRTTGNPWEDADIATGTGTTVTAPTSTSLGLSRTAVRFFMAQGTTGFGITSTDESLVYQGVSYGHTNGSISASQCCRVRENIGAISTGTASSTGYQNWVAATIVLRGLV